MTAMGFLLIGVAVAFNFIVIIRKYRLGRYFDAFLDMTILAIICFLFSGTFSALTTGTIASMFVSFYLYFNPVTLSTFMPKDEEDNDYAEDD